MVRRSVVFSVYVEPRARTQRRWSRFDATVASTSRFYLWWLPKWTGVCEPIPSTHTLSEPSDNDHKKHFRLCRRSFAPVTYFLIVDKQVSRVTRRTCQRHNSMWANLDLIAPRFPCPTIQQTHFAIAPIYCACIDCTMRINYGSKSARL